MSQSVSAGWSRRRKLTIALLAAVIPAVALFVAAESAGRAYIHFKYGVAGKSYGLWRSDEVLGAQHRENAYNSNAQTNDLGFRNTEAVLEPRPAGALRLIAYGGSTTFCYNLSNAETWATQLERLLRDADRRAHQVLNGGAIMWSLGHAYARAQEDIPALKPDYVLIYSGINEPTNAIFLAAQGDSLETLTQRGEYGRFATNLDQNRWVKRNLVTVRLIDYVLRPWIRSLRRPPDVPPAQVAAPSGPDPFVLENYLQVLERFIRLAQASGARAVFVVQAHDGKRARNAYLTSYSRAGAAVARASGAIVVDAAEILRTYDGDPGDLFSESGVHYSALGATKLAERLHAAIAAAEPDARRLGAAQP